MKIYWRLKNQILPNFRNYLVKSHLFGGGVGPGSNCGLRNGVKLKHKKIIIVKVFIIRLYTTIELRQNSKDEALHVSKLLRKHIKRGEGTIG